MGAQARATILLVEDDPGVARLEQLRLERAGYAVATAATAEEGLRRVADGRVELIVLDQQLTSGTSGLEFFRQVKAAGYSVPAILVTGMQEENLLVEALRAGVRDFVPKTQNFLNHLESQHALPLETSDGAFFDHVVLRGRIYQTHSLLDWLHELQHQLAETQR